MNHDEKLNELNLKINRTGFHSLEYAKSHKDYVIPVIAVMIILAGFVVGGIPAEKSTGFVVIDLTNFTPGNIRTGNEPFFFLSENNSKGLLMMHGFTASPWEVRKVGEALAKENITVFAPLIAGHATSMEDLKNTKWEDWYKSANESYSFLKGFVDCVYVGGESTGSTLALMLAEEHEVCGVITIGSPVFFQDWRVNFAWLVKYFKDYMPRELDDEEKPYYYEKRPVASIAELVEMIKVMKKDLGSVDEPILIIQSLNDETVSPRSADYIMDNIGSENKKLVLFDEGDHVLVRGTKQEEVIRLMKEFIS
ncbi:alpha/beta hydrolase [Candidatus Woesearchaeota archaeon]|nr:alpha/beta hydrolase [Candidatus Woesearchaeota archaeon]